MLPPPCSTSAAAPGDSAAAVAAAAVAAAVAAAAKEPAGGALPELRSLVLREERPLDTTMCAEAFQVILEAAPNLVRLSCGPFGTPRIVSLAPVIASLRRLQSLDISDNMMADPGAIAFGHNLPRIASTLTSLDISGNALTPAGMGALLPALESLRELRTLSLDGNHVGNECAESLARALNSISCLRHLSMHSLGLGDSALESIAPALARVTEVTFLGLSNNFIGCKGIDALAAQGLPHMSKLAELRLSGNWMLDEGACMLARAAGTVLTAMTKIALDHAFVSDVGAAALAGMAQQLSSLQQLSLSGNLIGYEGGTALCAVQSARVDLSGNPWHLGEVRCRFCLLLVFMRACGRFSWYMWVAHESVQSTFHHDVLHVRFWMHQMPAVSMCLFPLSLKGMETCCLVLSASRWCRIQGCRTWGWAHQVAWAAAEGVPAAACCPPSPSWAARVPTPPAGTASRDSTAAAAAPSGPGMHHSQRLARTLERLVAWPAAREAGRGAPASEFHGGTSWYAHALS